MFLNSSMMKTNYLLERAMDTSILRHKIIADNIANVDTPGFKRSRVTFEDQMARALASEQAMKKCPNAYLTDKNHIQFNIPMDYRKVRPKIHVDYDTSYRNDKNSVDIEKEVADAVINTLQFRALATSIKNNYRMLNSVL